MYMTEEQFRALRSLEERMYRTEPLTAEEMEEAQNILAFAIFEIESLHERMPEHDDIDNCRIEKIADKYGYQMQSRQLIEEMAELTQAINKLWRFEQGEVKPQLVWKERELRQNIIEEIADVEICLRQIRYLTREWTKEKFFPTVSYAIKEKLRRTIKRMRE